MSSRACVWVAALAHLRRAPLHTTARYNTIKRVSAQVNTTCGSLAVQIAPPAPPGGMGGTSGVTM